MFKKILFPVEKPEDFRYLIDKAALIKELGGEQIHLVHVIVSNEQIKDANRMLNHLTSSSALDFTFSYEVSTGHVASEISRIAREKALDLIYIRSNRARFINRLLLGCTASDIIRLADTPTLVDKTCPDHSSIDKILYATDFEIGAYKALPNLKKLASPARVLFVQFVRSRASDPISDIQRNEKAENDLQLLAQELVGYSSVITINSLGRPVTEISNSVAQSKIDLLILGRGNKTGIRKTIMGSTAKKLVSAVDCLVLMIP